MIYQNSNAVDMVRMASHATTEQLLAAIAAVRHYAGHLPTCDSTIPMGSNWPRFPCSCGIDDVLRGIDAMLAGRVTNHQSSTPHPADLRDARQDTIHVEQPAHRTTPIGGDDDGS